MLYADDAGVGSKSAEGLARMMTIIVEVFREFGPTVSERKTLTLVMRVKEKQPPPLPPPPLVIEAAGQRYAQTKEFRYLGGLVNEQGDLTREINHTSKAAWACFKRHKTELFDRPGAPFGLQGPPTQGGGSGSTTLRLRDMVPTPRPLPAAADDTSPVAPAIGLLHLAIRMNILKTAAGLPGKLTGALTGSHDVARMMETRIDDYKNVLQFLEQDSSGAFDYEVKRVDDLLKGLQALHIEHVKGGNILEHASKGINRAASLAEIQNQLRIIDEAAIRQFTAVAAKSAIGGQQMTEGLGVYPAPAGGPGNLDLRFGEGDSTRKGSISRLANKSEGAGDSTSANWQECFDDYAGKKYWRHRVTNKVTYNDPYDKQWRREASKSRMPDNHANWQECFDDYAGKKYWRHRVTNKVTYNDPYDAQWRREASKSRTPANPANWQECFDDYAGKKNWRHRVTNKVTYNDPYDEQWRREASKSRMSASDPDKLRPHYDYDDWEQLADAEGVYWKHRGTGDVRRKPDRWI
eukprot:g2990.t1